MSELHKFLFEGLPVRGMLVRLTDGWQELLRRRETAGPGQSGCLDRSGRGAWHAGHGGGI